MTNSDDSPDWSGLLARAREGADRAEFTPYMAMLCEPATLEDGTRLRLLGNAIADSPENRALLVASGLVPELVRPDVVCVSVLFNLVNGDAAGRAAVLAVDPEVLASVLVSTPNPGNKVLSELASDNAEFPADLAVALIKRGYIEIVLAAPSLETDAAVLEHFADVWEHALELEERDPESAVKIIGNISSHPTFTLATVENSGIEIKDSDTEPLSLVVPVLLANLTAQVDNIEAVAAKWPWVLRRTLDMLQEPPTEDEDETYLTSAYYVRNLTRKEQYAREILGDPKGDTAMLDSLLEPLFFSESYVEVGIQLAGNLGAVGFNPFVVNSLLEDVPSDDMSEYTSSLIVALAQAAETLHEEGEPFEQAKAAAKLLRDLIDNVPVIEQTTPLWIKATKGLALLSRAGIAVRDVAELEAAAPDHEGIKANIASIQSHDSHDSHESHERNSHE